MGRSNKNDNKENQSVLNFVVEATENFEKKVTKKRAPRKKKTDNVVNENPFIPSKYQEAIFNYVEHNSGNLIIEACSGSGKTTTILKCMALLPSNAEVLFAAFNKDIVQTIKKKLGKDSTASVRTIHSLGYILLTKYLGTYKLNMNEFKYTSYISSFKFKRKIKFENGEAERHKYENKALGNIKKLIRFSRCNLCNSVKDITALADKYSIDLVANEPELILDVMEYGKNNLEEFDFTDLIWLPNILEDIKNNYLKYDYIIVDEVQDVNKAQLGLILSCFKMGSRGIFVGDENQLIYGFTGTDSDSFNEIRSLPNTISLPLSISYRCPRKIVDYVHEYCSNIEAKEDAIDGEIIRKGKLDEIQGGDAVICRNNAPLFKAYAMLAEMGKEPKMAGTDMSDRLLETIKQAGQTKLNQDLNDDGLFGRLYLDLFHLKDDLIDKFGISEEYAVDSSIYCERLDTIQALELLSYGLKTTDELVNKIKELFSKRQNKDSDIILTTAHKSKGLEFNNVYILCDSLFHKKIKNEWERKQERNLAYVAYTRTKNRLCFVSEDGFENFLSNGIENTKMNMIDKDISRLYGYKSNKASSIQSVEDIKEIDLIKEKILPEVASLETIQITESQNSGLFSVSDRKKQMKKTK